MFTCRRCEYGGIDKHPVRPPVGQIDDDDDDDNHDHPVDKDIIR